MEDKNKQSILNIKFEKETHSIDAGTYARALTSVGTLVRELSLDRNVSPDAIKVKVVAQKPGSFDVVLNFIEDYSGTLQFITGVAMSIPGVILSLLEIKKILKDSSEVESAGGKVIIHNNEGSIEVNQNTYNIYTQNQAVNDSVSEMFSAVRDDKEIEAITLSDGRSKETYSRDSFVYMAKKNNIKSSDKEIEKVRAQLVVYKALIGEPNKMWGFIYQNEKISANIEDEEFCIKVRSGEESFANGDRIVCTLRIVRKYDKDLGAYINDSYTVTNITEHNKKSQYTQSRLEI